MLATIWVMSYCGPVAAASRFETQTDRINPLANIGPSYREPYSVHRDSASRCKNWFSYSLTKAGTFGCRSRRRAVPVRFVHRGRHALLGTTSGTIRRGRLALRGGNHVFQRVVLHTRPAVGRMGFSTALRRPNPRRITQHRTRHVIHCSRTCSIDCVSRTSGQNVPFSNWTNRPITISLPKDILQTLDFRAPDRILLLKESSGYCSAAPVRPVPRDRLSRF
jgi:hypothetical protein